MSISASLRPRSDSQTGFWAALIALFLALNGFLGLIALSFVDPAPIGKLTDVSRQLQTVRANTYAAGAAAALDDAAAQLQAAQRAISLEQGKAWRLRSYDRARGLITKAQRTLDGVQQSLEAPKQPATP